MTWAAGHSTLAERLEAALRRAGWVAGDHSRYGASRPTIDSILRGGRVKFSTVVEIAYALDVSCIWLATAWNAEPITLADDVCRRLTGIFDDLGFSKQPWFLHNGELTLNKIERLALSLVIQEELGIAWSRGQEQVWVNFEDLKRWVLIALVANRYDNWKAHYHIGMDAEAGRRRADEQ